MPNQCLLVPHDPLFLIFIESWFDEINTCQRPWMEVSSPLAKLVKTGFKFTFLICLFVLQVAKRGEVIQVKVLGTLAMIDEGNSISLSPVGLCVEFPKSIDNGNHDVDLSECSLLTLHAKTWCTLIKHESTLFMGYVFFFF